MGTTTPEVGATIAVNVIGLPNAAVAAEVLSDVVVGVITPIPDTLKVTIWVGPPPELETTTVIVPL
jgi:hypothetical protein